MTTIAELHNSNRIEGDVCVAGIVSRLDQHTNAAGNHSAVATLTDDTGSIDLHVYPRVWLDVHHLLHEGADVAADGLFYQAGDQLTVICTSLTMTSVSGAAAA